MSARRSTPFSGSSKRAITPLAKTIADRQTTLRTRTRCGQSIRLQGRAIALCVRVHRIEPFINQLRLADHNQKLFDTIISRFDHRADREAATFTFPWRPPLAGLTERAKWTGAKHPHQNRSRRTKGAFRSPRDTGGTPTRLSRRWRRAARWSRHRLKAVRRRRRGAPEKRETATGQARAGTAEVRGSKSLSSTRKSAQIRRDFLRHRIARHSRGLRRQQSVC